MDGFFPIGFWPSVAMVGVIICVVSAVDLMFGARLLRFLGNSVNKKYHVDKPIVSALEGLKKASDREFDVDSTLTRGWGRFVMSGFLLAGAVMLAINVLPKIK